MLKIRFPMGACALIQLTVAELLTLAKDALRGQGFPADSAADVAEEFVIAEVAGTKTHGLGKLVSLNLGDLAAEPTIQDRGAMLSVNGNRSNGFILFKNLAQTVSARCAQTGVCLAFAHNFSRYSSLYPYTSTIARKGYVGILMNTAGPPAVAPFGSVDPITGTNPICFSFPTSTGTPQTFDLATSEVVWGAIRQATLEKRGLPAGPFLSASGDVTTNPADVNAVRAFGGAKGWALNLAVEILAGPLAGAKAGLAVESEFDCGALIIAINPEATGAGADFGSHVVELLDSIRNSRPSNDGRTVRCPGDSGRSSYNLQELSTSKLTLPEGTLDMLRRMAAGERIAELSSNPLFN